MQAKSKGYCGESLAEKYLINKGYKILDKNFTVRGGEIDIIAHKNGIFVFAEVKTRTQNSFGEGNESVDSRKKKRILRAAQRYLDSKIKNPDPDFRLDIIEIELNSENGAVKNINHFEDIEV
ncbi:YraN family protein [Candidatus Peregrinibacteria bacterium]|nr:YraN family protein [Candidatus Peregrinibacteria bacterium]